LAVYLAISTAAGVVADLRLLQTDPYRIYSACYAVVSAQLDQRDRTERREALHGMVDSMVDSAIRPVGDK
jgi:hypothetical protein